MTKSFNLFEKLEKITSALNTKSSYDAKFMDKRAQKQSMRSLVVQNFDNYEETKTEDKSIEFGTPAQRLAYQRVRVNHSDR